jgi:PAS domain S-box-containing protein
MGEVLLSKAITKPDFKSLFECAPGCYLVLLPDLTIVAATEDYASVTMTNREEIIGKGMFDVFPENPDDASANGISKLKASFNIIFKNKVAHTMAVQKHDIRRPDGTFEERYWSPINKPVLNEYNEVIYIIHRVEDVTDFVRLQREHITKDKLASDLHALTLELEMEIFKRSQEIQRLNMELEQKVLERTIQLEEVNKTISDYKFALDASSIVAITDQNGIIKDVNDNLCKISKYRRDELIGQDHHLLHSDDHPTEFIDNLWVTIVNGSIWKGEIMNRAKDGTLYCFDTTIVPFLDERGKPYQFVAIHSDITQRKEAEQQLLNLKEELENKVKERTIELTQSLEREMESNELKSSFVSLASHEFRTPLSAILSSTSLIENYNKPEQEEKRKKHIERIKSSVSNLTDILSDFLSLDKIEQGKVEASMEIFNLEEFSEDIIEEIKGMLKKGQIIKYDHQGNNKIVQDKKILRNVVLNLLSNAIKYSPEQKVIYFNTTVNNNIISVTIKDNGIGIPLEEQKNIFNMFFRAMNAGTIQGTGLGLNIVKKYVELLDGNIYFSSIPKQGTIFTVELPYNSN